MRKHVLVTGGAGFIGSELVRQVAATGTSVTVVDNLVNGKRENLQHVLSDRVRIEVTDIRDNKRLKKLLKDVDVLFHLACLGVRHSIHSPIESHEVNATATLELLALAKEANIKRFVYVSSSEVYGTAHFVPITEECPTYPHTVYGASKLAGECYARAYWNTYQFPTVVIRPFNTYGPRCHHEGDCGEVIPKFLLRAMVGQPLIIFGDGTQSRDFTFVSDTAKGILEAGLLSESIGRTINIGYGQEITLNDLARIVKEVLAKPDVPVEHVESRPGDVQRLCADVSYAKELFGYKPTITLKKGLHHLLQWYKSLDVTIEQLLENEIERNWEIHT